MKRTILTATLSVFFLNLYAQPALLRSFELEYPVQRVIHYPKCGDSPLFLCNKASGTAHPEYILINSKVKYNLEKDEVLIYANASDLYTSKYLDEQIRLRKYSLKQDNYQVAAEQLLPKSQNGVRYNVQTQVINETLHYLTYQPFSGVKPADAVISFISVDDLRTMFEIKEELASYNIHCFSHDSILILKEYINTQTLTSHLFDHTGKLLSDESFHIAFKPEEHAPVFEYLDDDGLVLVVEQHDPRKTHIMKYSHQGNLLWDQSLDDYFYNVEEYKNVLVSYGGGDKTPHRLVFINEHTGHVEDELNLMDAYKSFADSHHLDNDKTTFFPLGLNSNPEGTWLTLMLNVYSRDYQSQHWDRVIVYRNHAKIDYIDLDLTSAEMPKVVPTDNDHLIITIGRQVSIYTIK